MLLRLRAVYDWMLRWAATPAALFVAGLVTCLAVLTPRIPAEIALILVMLPRAPRVWRAWSAAVAGCAVGVAIVICCGTPIDNSFPPEAMASATQMLAGHPWGALLGAAFVPTPLALFLTSAVQAGASLPMILLCAVVGRALRYALAALAMQQFGAWLRDMVAQHFREVVLIGVGAALMWGMLR